jgi:putative membrane protein
MKKSRIISGLTIIALGSCLVATAVAARPASPKASPSPLSSKIAATLGAGAKLSVSDKAFMRNAAKGGQMEVEWGKLAEQNGHDPNVKNFGKKMVTDHSKANKELMALAKEEGVSLPRGNAAGKWKSDKNYINMMVKDHEKDLAEFQKEASSGSDPDLKKFADKYSKVVQAHLDIAKGIQGKLK